MSLILDALRRAEAGRGQDLRQRLAQPLPAHARRKRQLRATPVAIIAIGAIAIAAALRWMMYSSSPAPVPAPPLTTEAEPAPTVAPTVQTRGSALADIALPEPRAVEVPTVPLDIRSSDAPLLLQLPDEIRASIPAMTVNAHFWSTDPSRRFIALDMRRYRDGDAVRDGLRVVRVLPDGAEMDWRGTRFRVSAQ